MRFWDASALLAVYVREEATPRVRALLEENASVAIWWGTRLEMRSAMGRKVRNRELHAEAAKAVGRAVSFDIETAFVEIAPSDAVRDLAGTLLDHHPLSGADALQLAAFLVRSDTNEFVCLDRRLRDAASAEGAVVLPLAV